MDDFFDTKDIMVEKENLTHWSGFYSLAIDRISGCTAPKLFGRDIGLIPIVPDFDIYLEELGQIKSEQSE
jgi:hypothetical protein